MSESPAPDVAPLGIGVVGLGRGFALSAAALHAHPGVRALAACDPDPITRAAFEREFGGRTYHRADALCADADVAAVYVATPPALHAPHVRLAARHGKAVLVEKPMAVTLDDARSMIAACAAADVPLLVGPSHGFDEPVRAARALIDSGDVGRVRMIQSFAWTDFLLRARRADDRVAASAGGIVLSQAVHQIDVVRRLAGARARSVSALTDRGPGSGSPGGADGEGAYAALIGFDGGVFATLAYSGRGRFDSDAWMDGIGELGHPKPADGFAAAHARSRDAAAMSRSRAFGHAPTPPAAPHHEHFGPLLVSCERADLRPVPAGVHVHRGDRPPELVRLAPPAVPRRAVLDALVAAVRGTPSSLHDGAWGLASLEICHALLESARTGDTVTLRHQGRSP